MLLLIFFPPYYSLKFMKDFPVLGVLPSSNENTFSPNPSLITEIDSLLEHSTGLEVHLERQH